MAMNRRLSARASSPKLSLPDTVLDEAILIPRSETKYWILLTDDQVELLARGIVGRETAQRAFNMLSWKREQYRACVEALEETHEEKNSTRVDRERLFQRPRTAAQNRR